MAGLAYNKRPNDVFVSYSHADGALVEPLMQWLQDVAGVRVWWDASRLVAGEPLGTALPQGLGSARSALFCVSRTWIQSTYCQREFNAALQEERADPRYRIIALRLDDCQVPPFLAGARYLEMQALNVDTGAALLAALVVEPAPWAHGNRDIYLSCSWHAADKASADLVIAALVSDGFRLIGDSPDYSAFDEGGRVRHIIDSCGALVAVLPFREDAANAFTSKWIMQEVRMAQELAKPYLLFVAAGVELDATLEQAAIGGRAYPLPAAEADNSLTVALAQLDEEYRPASRTAYSFLATSLREGREIDRIVNLVEQVTSMECLLGQRMSGQHAQREIVERIRKAQFVIADITANNLNSLIEAGIARGAGTRLHLFCKRPESGDLKTRFMFSDLEVEWYGDALQRLGEAHRIARMYRRRVYGMATS